MNLRASNMVTGRQNLGTFQIVQSCLALMIGLLLQNPEGCKDIVAIDGMVQFLCQSLETDMDPMAMMPSGRQEVILVGNRH